MPLASCLPAPNLALRRLLLSSDHPSPSPRAFFNIIKILRQGLATYADSAGAAVGTSLNNIAVDEAHSGGRSDRMDGRYWDAVVAECRSLAAKSFFYVFGFFFCLRSGCLALVEVGTILGGSVSHTAAPCHDGSLRQTAASVWRDPQPAVVALGSTSESHKFSQSTFHIWCETCRKCLSPPNKNCQIGFGISR